MNNYNTRHLAKILIHLAWCLEDCVSAADVTSLAFSKALNALFVSSVFLKYLIENSKTDDFEELYLSLDETEPVPHDFSKVGEGGNPGVLASVVVFMGKDIMCLLVLDLVLLTWFTLSQHVENLVMVSALNFIAKVDVSPGTYLLHQELLNFLLIAMSTQLLSGPTPGPNDIHPFIDAAMAQESSLVHVVVRQLLLNYIIRPRFSVNSLSSRILSEGNQPGVLRRVGSAAVDYVKDKSDDGSFEPLQKEETYFAENPFRKAVENARDIEFDRVDIEGNAHSGPLVRLPFASLFDTLGVCLAHETSVLLLYSLVHGNSDFLEYVLVRTDLDTLDVYLHTNCLATLANMAPHVYRLSAYASERLVSLFDMLSRKYNKLAEIKNDKMNTEDGDLRGDSFFEDPSAELHIYSDFLRLVLEILNAILTYALPLNPEVVYAIMHRQEVFLPFKSHPRYNELLENIYTVVDFFNSRIDSQKMDADWSVEEVLQVIINNCRSWRGEGMKMFTQLRFTYEQESHPEEFFIPYVWQLVLSHSGFTFNPSSINLFPVPVEDTNGEEVKKLQNGEMKAPALQVETPV
ncbi:UNVERIFIED_CONTAM: Dymeclin [Sesamum calycinum]|uniref:Dymeclin n=1 Tax=Sesamum calycinum TaxID=2727403 RepID=A0AAW2R903_9LAMI